MVWVNHWGYPDDFTHPAGDIIILVLEKIWVELELRNGIEKKVFGYPISIKIEKLF